MRAPRCEEPFRALARKVLDGIRLQQAAEPRLEQCGLLLASRGSSTVESAVAYPGPLFQTAFRLPEEWLLQALLKQRAQRCRVVGFYHTHPPGVALTPSAADLHGHPPASMVLLVRGDSWRVYRVSRDRTSWAALPLDLE